MTTIDDGNHTFHRHNNISGLNPLTQPSLVTSITRQNSNKDYSINTQQITHLPRNKDNIIINSKKRHGQGILVTTSLNYI